MLIITPKTKINDLPEAYPELEDTLISLAPEFKKLKNPVLRKTIARVASISQAAIIGGINLEYMVNQLRAEVGQSNIEQLDDSGSKYFTTQPEWYNENAVSCTLDIGEMLNRGEQPVHEVLSTIPHSTPAGLNSLANDIYTECDFC